MFTDYSMPSTPPEIKCTFLGCKQDKVFGTSSCQTHGGQRSQKYMDNKELYKLAVWQAIRTKVKSEYPICVSCLSRGVIVQTETVDHLFPHNRDKGRFLRNIFQALCVACHTQKTKLEMRGVYRHYIGKKFVDYSEKDYTTVAK